MTAALEALETIIQKKIAMLSEHARKERRWQFLWGTRTDAASLAAESPRWEDAPGIGFSWQGDMDLWLRREFSVPESVCGMPIRNTAIRLSSGIIGAPTTVFIDGKKVFFEQYWADLRTPEVVFSPRASPGDSFEILVRIENQRDKRRDSISVKFDKVSLPILKRQRPGIATCLRCRLVGEAHGVIGNGHPVFCIIK